MNNGKLFVFSAPRAVEKQPLCIICYSKISPWVFLYPQLRVPLRANEVNGKDYYFMSEKAFQAKIEAGEFIEYGRSLYWSTLRYTEI